MNLPELEHFLSRDVKRTEHLIELLQLVRNAQGIEQAISETTLRLKDMHTQEQLLAVSINDAQAELKLHEQKAIEMAELSAHNHAVKMQELEQEEANIQHRIDALHEKYATDSARLLAAHEERMARYVASETSITTKITELQAEWDKLRRMVS